MTEWEPREHSLKSPSIRCQNGPSALEGPFSYCRTFSALFSQQVFGHLVKSLSVYYDNKESTIKQIIGNDQVGAHSLC